MIKTESNKYPTMIVPYNAQHIGRRDEQQDYFAYSNIFNKVEQKNLGAVAVLADGMGGMRNGRQASYMGTDVFLKSYLESNVDDINDRLVYAAHKANEKVKLLDGAGSTLAAVVIKDWKLYWISIGDSRIYLYRKGTLRRINNEHNYESVLSDMVLRGEITVEEAINDPNRAALTSYLGIENLEEIDLNVNEFPLFRGDSLLLCSDGLYRALSDEEMSEVVMEADDNVCEELVSLALSKNDPSQDNITVMLMDID